MQESKSGSLSDETDPTKRELWDLLVRVEAEGKLPEGLSIVNLHGAYSTALEDMLRVFSDAEKVLIENFKEIVDQTLGAANDFKAKMNAPA